MAKSDENRFTRVYHTMVSILCLLVGAAILGLGIWLTTTGNKGIFNLNYTGDNVFRVVLRANLALMCIGGFLIFTAVISLVSLARNCLGKTFRVVYVLLAALILVALLGACVISSLLLANRDNKDMRRYVGDAWKETVDNEHDIVCGLEEQLQCRGFEDSDCVLCVTGLEAACPPEAKSWCAPCGTASAHHSNGCYNEIIDRITPVLLPTAIVSAILAAIVLVDMLFMCCL